MLLDDAAERVQNFEQLAAVHCFSHIHVLLVILLHGAQDVVSLDERCDAANLVEGRPSLDELAQTRRCGFAIDLHLVVVVSILISARRHGTTCINICFAGCSELFSH